MSGLFGGGKKATSHATRAMGIDFQGAQYGPVIPVVYGRNKVPGNCLWYGDFQSHAQQQKAGKGGGGGGTTNYTYSASAQMGLCEGPGIGLRTVYDGTSVVNLSSINYAFASGAIGQAAWSHLSGSAALGYSLTAIFSFQNLDLGSQASLPNYNYELDALKQFSGSIPDANPRDILSDICSDPYHGVNFPYLGDLTQYSNYCVGNGLFLSPVYDQQQSANQALSDLFKYTNTYAYYSEDQLKVVPLGDTAVTGNGVTFTPNVTPVVNLGTDDFIPDGEGGPSISIDRKAPQDNLNLVRVEFKDRANTYHDSAAVAAIDEDIITNGGRSDDSETVNGCTTAAVARFIAQNMVQRAFYIRNTYQFKLSWRYCYLEPTDIVTLTDAALGLNLYPVRITEIEEDGESALTITAEEFPEGIGHSAIYNTQPNGGTNIDQNADPGAVNPPFLFRGPGFLVTGSNPEIWCAVNGSNAMWAGCEVYLSHDGTSYTFAGTVASQARYGSLTAALAAGTADPDITNTPTVQVYAPAELLGGSQTDADNFVTLAMVDSEIIAYETATLQSANTYQLGYLRRGGYGSANVAHNAGAPFVRLDDSIFRMPVDPSLIGSTVYLKFLSLNAFGRTPRTLAEETAYTYIIGTNVELPDVPDVPASFAVQGVADGVSITWTNDNPAAVGCTSIERATASGGPWTVLAQVGPTTTAYHDSFTTGSTYYYRARARGPLVQSGWSTYTGVISSAGKTVANGATNGATIGPGGNVNGAVDGNGRALIDFSQGAHLGKHLGNVPDDPTSTRYAVSKIDGNRRALVDATQAGHVGAWSIDSRVADGTNFQRVGSGYADTSGRIVNLWDGVAVRSAVNTWDGANRARTGLDSSGIIVAGMHPVDNLKDGTFARTLGSRLQNGVPLMSPTGRNMVVNGGWELNNVGTPLNTVLAANAPCGDGWVAIANQWLPQLQTGAHNSGAQSAGFSIGNGAVIPTGTTFGVVQSADTIPVRPDDTLYLGASFFWNYNYAMPAGVTMSLNARIVFLDTNGNQLPSQPVVVTTGTQGFNNFGGSPLTVTGAVPAAASKAYFQYFIQVINSNATAVTIPAGNNYVLVGYCDDLFCYALTNLDTDAQDGTLFGRTAQTYLSSNRPVFDLNDTFHRNKSQDYLPAGATYGQTALADLYSSGGVSRVGLRIPGSGHQLGDQFNSPPIASANLRSTWTGQTISYSATAGSPATATISVTAATLLAGDASKAYNAMSVGVSGTGGSTVTYYLYFDDPTYAGGAQTLVATTAGSNIYGANRRMYVGSIPVTFPTSGSGSGGGSGGGGACVALGAYGPQGRFDRETRCVDTPDGAVSVRKLKTSHQKCVRVEYGNGTILTCSEDAPLMDGQRKVLAIDALGETLDTSEGPSRVCRVESAGILEVVSIDAGDVAYYAADNPDGPFALHHNKIIP